MDLDNGKKKVIIPGKQSELLMQKVSNFKMETTTGKRKLREQIREKNNLVKELGKNQKYFQKEFKKRVEEFMKKIKFELKSRVFDRVLKNNLHYIYRHYETLKKNEKSALMIMNSNLTKIETESHKVISNNK